MATPIANIAAGADAFPSQITYHFRTVATFQRNGYGVRVREVNCRNANRLYGMESLPSEGVGEIRSARVIVGCSAARF